jgi:sorbitol-specific phosphotransferase system component IIBC
VLWLPGLHADPTLATNIVHIPNSNLLDNDLALHASTLVGLAVVAVLASGGELGGHLLSRGVQVVLVAQSVGVLAGLQGSTGNIGHKLSEIAQTGLLLLPHLQHCCWLLLAFSPPIDSIVNK